VIAVVDSGVEASHPDLAGAVDGGYDFVDEDTDAADLNGHGTAVAGIAAARANNGLGAAGVCWMCRILPLRVLRPEGFALKTTMARAIDYAVDHRAAVVNLSLYGEDDNAQLDASIRRARAAGVLVATAAGNEGWTTFEYPAAYPEAISVGATTEDGRLASYSNRGEWVKLAAPACNPTTQLGGGFGAGCGTSGATPVVAGVIALMRSRAPFATAGQIEEALVRTARPVPGVRFGLIDALAALQALGDPGPRVEASVHGTPAAGQTLTALSGIWVGAGLAFTYRWERCFIERCDSVGTEKTYTVQRADAGARLRVTIESFVAGSGVSPLTALVPLRPRNAKAPKISGRAVVGATLKGNRGSWTGTALGFSSRWIRCRTLVCRGAVTVGFGRSYRVRNADRGSRLRWLVIATNSAGTAAASSAPTSRVRVR
jgi:hypothetical protein